MLTARKFFSPALQIWTDNENSMLVKNTGDT